MKDEWFVYSKSLARYLIDKGFTPLRVVGDLINPKFYNWVFKNSDKLQLAIDDYTKSYNEWLAQQ